MLKAQQNYKVGIYVRLSKDDERAGESVSIKNQKLMLTKYCEEQGWNDYSLYCDDGASGTNFDRPGVTRLIEDAKDGKIDLILVKDLSRFGRNYIQVGQFTDYLFPMIGVRFIALNDGVDTLHSDNDIMPFRNLLNEFQSKDTSKKIKAVKQTHAKRTIFEQVQEKRGKIRKRRTNEGERSLFSGLLVCADCGHNLHFHFNQGNPDIKYFNCSNYKGNRGTCTSTHYVRVDFLEQVVLGEIRRLTKYASLYEDDFIKAVIGHSQETAEQERRLKEKELKTLLARDDELDVLFERIYEDNVSGKLSDDRFAKMSHRYEEEQKELAEKIKLLRSQVEKQTGKSVTTDMFIGMVRKYTRARKLTPRMLNELVEKIEVYNAEKVDGVWEQRLRIHYNCVGEITIPKVLPLPIPDVFVNTRKGVTVSYAPCEIAI